MKKTFGIACWILLNLTAFGVNSAKAEEVVLSAVGAFNKDAQFDMPLQNFISFVNENGKGVVQIRYAGGPEAVPPLELGSAVTSGVVDVAGISHAYYTNHFAGAAMLKVATNTIQDQRENGCYDKMDLLHQQRMNVKFLGRSFDGLQYHLFLNKRVDTADLTGLNIRVAAPYQAMFSALGANMVNMSPGDTYSALERGTVDGYGWPMIGIFDYGLNEHTMYRVDPGFYQVDTSVLINFDKWQSLTDDQRAVLKKAMQHVEALNVDIVKLAEAEKQRQKESGIETIELQGAEARKWLSVAIDAGTSEIASADPEAVDILHHCMLSGR